MKIFKKSTLCILFVFIFILTACGETNQTQAESVKLIQGFETYEEIVMFRYSTPLGDVSLNKDESFITEGDASLRILVADPEKSAGIVGTTVMSVPLEHINGQKNNDISKFSEITFDVYNDSEHEATMSIALAIITNARNIGSPQRIVLEPKAWTEVSFNIDPTVIGLTMDIGNITHIDFTISGIDTLLYVDNLQGHLTSYVRDPLEIYLDENEFLFFEKDYQELVVYSVESLGVHPGVKVVSDPTFAYEGNRYLEIVNDASSSGSWPRLKFSSLVSELADIRGRSPESYFVFNFRKTWSGVWAISLRFLNLNNNTGRTVGVRFTEANEWITVAVPISSFLLGTNALEFTWSGNMPEERSFYLDYLRFENELPEDAYLMG